MSNIKKLLSVSEALTELAESIKDLITTMNENTPPTATTEPVMERSKEEETVNPAPRIVTMEQVRAVLAKKSRNGQAEVVRDLLKKYGSNKLSSIKPEDYPALMAEAEVLGDAE